MKKIFLLTIFFIIFLMIQVFTVELAEAVPLTSLPELDLLTPYATFGNYFNDSNVTIYGNAGISQGGILKLESPSTINGDLLLGASVATSGGGWPTNVSGSIAYNQDLAATQAQVFSAADALALLAPDYTFASLSTGLTINGNSAVTVINIAGNVDLGSGEDIIFNGSDSDYFVLNIFGDLDMGGDATISNIGDAGASHLLINLYNSGNLGNVAHVNNIINGTVLVPYATYAEFHSVFGAIYSGYGQMKLMSGAQVVYEPYGQPEIQTNPVPEPNTLLLLGLGLISVAGFRRKFKK